MAIANFHLDFEYDNGKLISKRKARKYEAGREVGYIDCHGYVCTKYKGKMYKVHRIIWMMFYGEIPDGLQIDHINGIRHDNRIENLRLVTASVNQKNRKLNKNNKSGHVGVSYHKMSGKWQVRVIANGIVNYSMHSTFCKAVEAARSVYSSDKEFTERHGK